MWLVNLVSVAVAASFFAATCQSASVPETAVETRTPRVSIMDNKYYLMTWQNLQDGTGMEEVANTADDINALSLTGLENVAIVVHGRNDGARSEFGELLRNTLIQADREMAVILVDWSLIAALNYDLAFILVQTVAQDLIAFIAQMELSGKLDRGLLHLIGFDLGAHIVGITSRNPTARARKITALSPAGEGWDRFSDRLKASDAQFVEVIHTDAVGNRAFGLTESIGGCLEFYPNGGTRQPGCANSDNLCHQKRAWQLFRATVEEGGRHLRGNYCETTTQVNNNRCDANRQAFMGGLDMFKLDTGLYRVNTGRVYPYYP